MRKIFIILCCILLQLVQAFNIKAQTNLIQNGNFESFDLTCCNYSSTICGKISNYIDYFNNTTLPAYIAPFNTLCVANWKCSHGSPDLGVTNCLYPECPGNFATLYGAPQYNISEGIFIDNLNLSPNSIYTLSFIMASPVGAYQPFIKLTNDLVHNTNYRNNAMPQIINSQTIFSATSVRNLNSWEEVRFDFVPNAQYSQVWIYLTSGWIHIDNVSLILKTPYNGPVPSTLACCGTDIIYTNSILPAGTSKNESIIIQQSTSLPNNQDVSLTAGNFIQFLPDLVLSATNTTTLSASIVNCKSKPLVDVFGGGISADIVNYCTDYYNSSSTIGVNNKLEQGVSYLWSASPSNVLDYIENTSSPYTHIVIPSHTTFNATYTLTASNNCGSISSSIAVDASCTPYRMGNIDPNEDNLQNDQSNTFAYYPNPTHGKFTLKVSEDLLNIDFQISDITGKNIMKGSTAELENSIDLTDQPSGIYYITLLSKGKIIREKLIIL